MTQEDKSLLLQDLCARLPYNVKVDITYSKEHGSSDRLQICSEGYLILNTDVLGLYIQDEINLKPYLRPMSFMTKEDIKDLEKYTFYSFTYNPGDVEIRNTQYQAYDGSSFDPFVKGTFNMPISSCSCVRLIKWLNSHHFDYLGLIEKGLALEAKENMYIL